MKKLAGTKWGCSREVLLTTCKAIGRPVLNYGAPIWTPVISQCRWADLQRRQNAAMRIITGCHMMTSSDHLHHECQLLPVKEHNELLSRQFHLSAHLPLRPDNHTVPPRPTNARNIRPTLRSKFEADISVHVPTDGLNDQAYRTALASTPNCRG